MSEKNIEIVRRFNETWEGDDLIPVIRAAVEELGSEPDWGAVLAY